jgi:hypothetical protein
MTRVNFSSISRFFSPSKSSSTETPRNDGPRSSGHGTSASAGAALSRLEPRAAHAPSTSAGTTARPRAGVPGAQKKKVSWAPDTLENGSLAALMDKERSTALTRWGMKLPRKLQSHPIEDPELQEIKATIGQNKFAESQGLLHSDDSDSESEIRPADSHPQALDMQAMLRQAGLADEDSH